MPVDPNDPRPQVQIAVEGGTRQAAFRGPYVDQALTTRNLAGQSSEAVDPTDIAKGVRQGGTRVYEDAATSHGPSANQPSDLPGSPNSWRPGRDYYKNGGMVGQDFFGNNP